jgi:hypothetical protein
LKHTKLSVDACIDALKNFHILQPEARAQLLETMRKTPLLTEDIASAKLAKSAKFSKSKLRTYIMYLSPATMAYQALGRVGTLCPAASAGCAASCLNTAGRGRFNSVASARLRKTLYYIQARAEFTAQLFAEVKRLEIKAKRDKVKLCIRLNGTSDLPLYLLKDASTGLNIFETFPKVQFYDYTKVYVYLERSKAYKNWYVTFSASESNQLQIDAALAAGFNVAMPFFEVPKVFNGARTIDGDKHDLRFLDKRGGFIVALKAKGEARYDASGFVRLVPSACASTKQAA